MKRHVRLGINIDHVATLRNARGENYPEVTEAARIVEKSGADLVTVHVREDRRHINEKDLDKALRENIIFGAGLDVFENEPIDKTNPLLSNKKVLLSPHSATFTNECKSRMSLETTKNIIDFFENKIDKSMIVKL